MFHLVLGWVMTKEIILSSCQPLKFRRKPSNIFSTTIIELVFINVVKWFGLKSTAHLCKEICCFKL